MSLLKGLLNETRKITEADMFPEEQVAPAPETEVAPTEEVAPVEEVPAEDVETEETEDIEITDELIAELAETNPAISEVDPAQFKEGLENEIQWLELIGGDINVVAALVLAHINEFPGKDYYAALAGMENGLKEDEPVEGDEEVAPVEDEVAAEGELDADQPAFEGEDEEVVEEAKEKQAKGKAMSQVKNESKDANKDEKDENKTAAKEKEQEIELKKKQVADDKKKNKE